MTDHVAVPTAAPGDPASPGPTSPSVTKAIPPRCLTRTRLYQSGRLVAEGFPAERIRGHLAEQSDAVVWLDLYDPDVADLGIVTEEFDLHPLAVEDAILDHQRPKLDRYPTHLFVNVYAVALPSSDRSPDSDLAATELSAFVTPRALITIRKSAYDIDQVIARWDAPGAPVSSGVGFLVHGWLNAVVDSHYQAAQALEDVADELEDALFDPGRRAEIRRRGFALRRSLSRLRRTTAPMREVVGRLIRDDARTGLLDEAINPYMHDVHDQAAGAAETVDSAREHVGSILDTNLGEQGNELNVITRKLAAWAAIIAVPTAVTGFYGQNVPYPGFSQPWGFATSAVLIVVLACGLYALLRHRGWL
jgi:magnesium transporter